MTRKYRQRGYQDDDRAGPRTRDAKPPPPRRDGPRGRGLGAPGRTLSRCGRCGEPVAALPVPDAACARCGQALHSCANCRHFDTAAPNECRAGVAVRIASKTGANDCDLFELKMVQELGGDGKPSADDARSAFDALFDF